MQRGRTAVDGGATAGHVAEVRDLARPLDRAEQLDPLLDRVGDAHLVLLGEASHGTSEYYRWRFEITRRLVEEKGFSFIAVEGDWPDCSRINRWVKGLDPATATAREVLAGFERWPTWMWANEEVVELVTWLRRHNERRTSGERGTGFYGLDVYSLWDSLRVVMEYLGEHEREALDAAHEAWRCFEPYREDPQGYAWATTGLVPATCEDAVVDLLRRLRSAPAGSGDDEEARFDARQNAEVAWGAERYYRVMVRSDAQSWNVRDTHMADTLDRLLSHHGPGAKAVVWAHNTHVGDARGTDMAAAGMLNIGQLVRDRHGDHDVVLVGFGGYEGSVVAAGSWGDPARRLPVPPAPADSHEALIHELGRDRALFVFPEGRAVDWLGRWRGHRAIGVVYRPERERFGNWVPTVLGRRYDAFCAFDQTEALHPLGGEAPQPGKEQEAWPFGQ